MIIENKKGSYNPPVNRKIHIMYLVGSLDLVVGLKGGFIGRSA